MGLRHMWRTEVISPESRPRIRHPKNSGPGRFPPHEFDLNQTWLTLRRARGRPERVGQPSGLHRMPSCSRVASRKRGPSASCTSRPGSPMARDGDDCVPLTLGYGRPRSSRTPRPHNLPNPIHPHTRSPPGDPQPAARQRQPAKSTAIDAPHPATASPTTS